MVKVSKSSRKSVAQCTLERQRNIIKQQNDLNAQLQKEKDALVAANVILIQQSTQESTTLRQKLKAEEESTAELRDKLQAQQALLEESSIASHKRAEAFEEEKERMLKKIEALQVRMRYHQLMKNSI